MAWDTLVDHRRDFTNTMYMYPYSITIVLTINVWSKNRYRIVPGHESACTSFRFVNIVIFINLRPVCMSSNKINAVISGVRCKRGVPVQTKTPADHLHSLNKSFDNSTSKSRRDLRLHTESPRILR